jgi:hypothetical protein
VLVLDNYEEGGSASYRKNRFKNSSDIILLWQHIFNIGTYLVTIQENNDKKFYRSLELNSLVKWIDNQQIKHVLINNLYEWPKHEEVVDVILKHFNRDNLEIFLHDYLYICPSFCLLNKSTKFCNIPEDTAICNECLIYNPNISIYKCQDIMAWRESWLPLLIYCNKIIAPDKSVGDLYYKAFPQINNKIKIEPHQSLKTSWQPITKYSKFPLHIGIIGNINLNKGAYIVRDLLNLLQSENFDYHVTVIGKIAINIRAKNFSVTGHYEHDDLPKIIDKFKINVGVLPSIWPETFSYVAQEIILLNLPFVCLNLGAQAEKAKEYSKGFLAATPDAAGLLEAILQAYYTCVKE